jgi:hypothetical protein
VATDAEGPEQQQVEDLGQRLPASEMEEEIDRCNNKTRGTERERERSERQVVDLDKYFATSSFSLTDSPSLSFSYLFLLENPLHSTFWAGDWAFVPVALPSKVFQSVPSSLFDVPETFSSFFWPLAPRWLFFLVPSIGAATDTAGCCCCVEERRAVVLFAEESQSIWPWPLERNSQPQLDDSRACLIGLRCRWLLV